MPAERNILLLPRPNNSDIEYLPIKLNCQALYGIRLLDTQRKKSSALLQLLNQYHYGTFIHSLEVGWVSYLVGKKMGLSDEQQQTIATAGRLHDVGKLTIPQSSFDNYGSRTEEEKVTIKSHSELSQQIITFVGLDEIYGRLIVDHHNKHHKIEPDHELSIEDIMAYIIVIADCLSAALDHDRGYKKPSKISEALIGLKKRFQRGTLPKCLENPLEQVIEDGLLLSADY